MVSRRTALRYIRALRERGELEKDGERRGRHVHKIALRSKDAASFSLEEIFWQRLMERSAGAFAGTGLDEAFARVSAKMEATLRPADRDRLQGLDRKIHDLPEGRRSFGESAEIMDEIVTALLDERPLHVKQGSRGKDARKFRLDPYTLVTHKRGLYLVGYSHYHDAVRLFAFESILAAERVRGAKFVVPASYHPSKFFEGRWGVWSGDETEVKLRFAREVEPWLRRTTWHPTQRLRTRGAHVIMNLTTRGTVELLSWILSWGDKVAVVSPRSLRDEWLAAARGVLARGEQLQREDPEIDLDDADAGI